MASNQTPKILWKDSEFSLHEDFKAFQEEYHEGDRIWYITAERKNLKQLTDEFHKKLLSVPSTFRSPVSEIIEQLKYFWPDYGRVAEPTEQLDEKSVLSMPSKEPWNQSGFNVSPTTQQPPSVHGEITKWRSPSFFLSKGIQMVQIRPMRKLQLD